MSFLFTLAESSSLDGAIRFVELLMSMTALPAVIGFFVLLRHHFRASGAGTALFLGLLTVLAAGCLCALLRWNNWAWEWYQVPGASLLVGLLVCALAWYARRTQPST